jgi:hypothetical protein
MARLRILELPAGDRDERPPFTVVIDQIGDGDAAAQLLGSPGDGAVTADIPEADYPLRMASVDEPAPEEGETAAPALAALALDTLGIDLTAGQPVPAHALDNACRQLAKSEDARKHLRDDIKAMSRQLREAFGIGDDPAVDALGSAIAMLNDARSWARHGYEIGQRHCGWTDHGVAPAWLTEGWPPHIDSCEHSKQAAEYDTALTRVGSLTDSPGGGYESDSDYAFGYRAAIAEAKRAAGGAGHKKVKSDPEGTS